MGDPAEWIAYAEGFTSGSLRGDEARNAFARATWQEIASCHSFHAHLIILGFMLTFPELYLLPVS